MSRGKRSTLTSLKRLLNELGENIRLARLRRKFAAIIHTGDELLFEARSDGVIEIKQLESSIEMFFGRCKHGNQRPMSVKEMDAAIMQAVNEGEKSE